LSKAETRSELGSWQCTTEQSVLSAAINIRQIVTKCSGLLLALFTATMGISSMVFDHPDSSGVIRITGKCLARLRASLKKIL
jgi:hypothetical protein